MEASDEQDADERHDGAADKDKYSTAEKRNDDDDSVLKRVSSSCADCYFPCRYIVVILLFLGMCFVHAQRVNVGVTVVGIVDDGDEMVLIQNDDESQDNSSVIVHIKDPSLASVDWNSMQIGWLHAIFYVGLLISQMPCGYIVTKLPSHNLFGACILLTHSLNFLLPLAIGKIGYCFTMGVRLLQGVIEGLLYPSTYDVLRHWSVPEERSRAGATVLTGAYIGPTIGMIASGQLTHHLGWESVFYFHGAIGVVLFFVWLILVYEKPSVHPWISSEECKMIESKQGETAIIYEHESVPWKAIFTSLPVWALIVCNFARSFVFYMMLTNEPTYLNIFDFSIAEIGLYSSLPYVFMGMFSLSSGLVADYLNAHHFYTLTVIRKLLTCSGFGSSAVFFFGLSMVVDGITAVALLTVAVGLSGIAISGWQVNHLDIAPRYAGVLVGISMTAGMVAGVLNPLIVAILVRDQTIEEWHRVFFLTACVLCFALTVYAIFGTAERQSWANPSLP